MRLVLMVCVAGFALPPLAQQALAQQRSGTVGQLNPVGGSGNVWTPGTPHAGANGGTGSVTTAGNGRTGGGARPRGGVNNRNGYGSSYGGGAILVPYPVAGAGGPVYTPAPCEYDSIFGVYNPGPGGYVEQGATPTVIINQNFQPQTASPKIRDYSNAMLPPPGPQTNSNAALGASSGTSATSIDGDTPLILIAMKDHTIYPALAYWVQGDTLNYVMVGGAVNHASITAVDRALTAKLNSERNVEFHLPDTK